jgi:hypothetical protein
VLHGLIDCNAAFDGLMTFFYTPGIDYIDDDNFYFGLDTLEEINALRTTNVVPNAINVYFANDPTIQGYSSICGISSFTTSPVQGIVMNNDCTGVPSNPSTYPHELGHYFDLFHTHETAFGVELVNGSNCGTAGDLLCDTPADPRLSNALVNSSCAYIGNLLDPNGDPYDPDPRQYMSYSRKLCRDRFTPMSDTRALATLLDLRGELHIPVCDAGGPYEGDVGEPIALSGSASFDPNGQITLYEWDFGDGSSSSGSSSGVLHTYVESGEYTVTLCVTDDDLEKTCCETSALIRGTVDVEGVSASVPTRPFVGPSRPNPATSSSTVIFGLPEGGLVTLDVYTVSGRLVATVVQEYFEEGIHSAVWNGRDNSGQPCASGVYIYNLRVGDQTLSRSMTLVR